MATPEKRILREVLGFERPGPKSVSPAMNCPGVEMVVWWRWIVDMSAPCVAACAERCGRKNAVLPRTRLSDVGIGYAGLIRSIPVKRRLQH
jgi:hypothetical protein